MLRATADAMVRLGEAGIAALRAFFGTKRGTRQLIESPPSSRGIPLSGARGRAQGDATDTELAAYSPGGAPSRAVCGMW